MQNKDNTIEETKTLLPCYNEDGLIACIATDHKTGEVLMMAWMNEQALRKTLETGEMHYWSRSRGELWHKGATSGNVQTLIEMRIDCDQDCLLAKVEMPAGADGNVSACHTGRKSCFYRVVEKNGKASLQFSEEA